MKYVPALLVLACLWLTACGQTGPLYLPDADPIAAEAPASEDPSAKDL